MLYLVTSDWVVLRNAWSEGCHREVKLVLPDVKELQLLVELDDLLAEIVVLLAQKRKSIAVSADEDPSVEADFNNADQLLVVAF